MGTVSTKDRSDGTLMAWTLLDDNASGVPWLDSGQLDISSEMYCMLHIAIAECNTETIATQAIAKVWGAAGDTADDWHLITEVGYGTVASLVMDFSGITSGDTSMGTADTTGVEGYGKVAFIKHGTMANSMMNTVVDFSNDSEIYFLNAATQDYSDGCSLYCQSASSGSGVAMFDVEVPDGYSAAKVSFHNPDDNANYACRVRYTKVIDVSAV